MAIHGANFAGGAGHEYACRFGSFELGWREVAATLSGDANLFLSPLSLRLSLATAAAGARGATRAAHLHIYLAYLCAAIADRRRPRRPSAKRSVGFEEPTQ